jgi:hypothetical protein
MSHTSTISQLNSDLYNESAYIGIVDHKANAIDGLSHPSIIVDLSILTCIQLTVASQGTRESAFSVGANINTDISYSPEVPLL